MDWRFLWIQIVCLQTSTEIGSVWFENRLSAVGSGDQSGADVCIWLRTPFGWKTEFISGNCMREAHEFIPWTMKTFDHRG
jgi:hypothetical protein